MNNYIDFHNGLKMVFAHCPCCNKIYRLSDSRIYAGNKPQKDWLTKLDEELEKLEKQEAILLEKLKLTKTDAIQQGRVQADSLVSNIDPIFKPIGLNPNDSKTILHPIDYIVFNGMNDNTKTPVIKNIVLLDKATNDRVTIQESIRDLVENDRYDFMTVRIDDDGNIFHE